jgi:hypothetical protein
LRRKAGLEREIPKEDSWVLQQLSSNALTLSGFSFTSLVFMIGFLGRSVPVSVTSGLLLCTITFAVAGEMARTSYSLEEYVVSEALYFISLVLLFYNFITLTYETLKMWGVLPILAAIVGMLYVIWRTVANFKLLRTSHRR